jgi:hypothetical protein
MDIRNALKRLKTGFVDEMGIDRTDLTQAHYQSRQERGETPDVDRLTNMTANYRPAQLIRDSLGISDPTYRRVREEKGLGLRQDPMERAGQILAAPVRDVANDDTRNWWWLMNAAQAVGNVGTEHAFRRVAPEMYQQRDLGMNINEEIGRRAALDAGKVKETKQGLKLKSGVEKDSSGNLSERNVRGGHAALLLFPSGAAINTGLGLMTPFGGAQGYEAAIPDAEDPSKTANVVAEVGAKYFLGRTGNLLDYDEFSQARPDVSKGEYNAYKAFKYDKKTDLDLTDGDFTLPAGVLKGTTDGLHGAELQFLGRSLPATTVGVPLMASIAGGVLAGRGTRNRTGRNLWRNMAIGTTAGTVGGMAVGNLLEAERRRRNGEQNDSEIQF